MALIEYKLNDKNFKEVLYSDISNVLYVKFNVMQTFIFYKVPVKIFKKFICSDNKKIFLDSKIGPVYESRLIKR